jgi:hypothetical protein
MGEQLVFDANVLLTVADRAATTARPEEQFEKVGQ